MKKWIASALVLAYFALLAGCNTVEGVGKDVEKGGEKMQNSAEKNKSY